MGRDVPFDVDEKCDICGEPGAYDFYGDFICQECLLLGTLEEELGNGESNE